MKKLLLAAVLFSATMIVSKKAESQVNVQINIGRQPVWGPVGYYYVEYYYLPDIDAYYYVPRRQFVYLSNGRWVFASSLPAVYRDYDLYSGYKVVVNEPRPYLHADVYRSDVYRSKYGSYKGRRNEQIIIRNSDEPRYYVVKGHPKHKDKGNRGRGKGKGRH
jgi:hypothetical protein